MANPEHLEILKRDAKEWKKWRDAHPDISPDFSRADLREANLREADLSGANLTGADLAGINLRRANLNKANLSRADLTKADLSRASLFRENLSEANLSGANLSGANLRVADLSGANLTGADLRAADLRVADLSGANLSGANLNMTNLSGSNLAGANLSGADLTEAYLTDASLTNAVLQYTSLQASRLMNANFDGANLTRACLWETQRAGWSIKGVICESVYWDRERKKLDTFEPGDFERLYSEKARVQIKYPGGISAVEIATLPGLIQHLESLHTGTRLRFESIQDASGGAVAHLVFDDAGDISPEQIEELRTAIESEAKQKTLFLRHALEGELQFLKGEVQALERTVDKLLLNRKPTIYLGEGDLNMSGDIYNIPGQAGAVGPNAHAHDNTFNQFQQIGRQIEQSMDLAALATELETLRRALKKEAVTEEHDLAVVDIGVAKRAAEAKDSGKLAGALKSAGKWALDVATKIGVSLATEAIKQSTEMK